MRYFPGSLGETVDLARGDETLRARLVSFADFREQLFNELDDAETGRLRNEGGVPLLRCVGAADTEGFIHARFSLRSFFVDVLCLHDGAHLRSVAPRAETRINDRVATPSQIGDGREMYGELARFGMRWQGRNPVLWQSLALAYLWAPPTLCPSCRMLRDNCVCGHARAIGGAK